MKLDLRTQSGEPIPLLTTDKNRAVDAAVLSAVAELHISAEAVREAIDDDLRQIAMASPLAAADAARQLRDALTTHAKELGGDEAVRFAREQADPLLTFANGLVSNSLLWVRVYGAQAERKIVKIAFEDPVRQEQNTRRRLFSSFSWQAITAEYTVPHIGNSGIYHCQIDPPAELQMVGATLILDQAGATSAGQQSQPRGRPRASLLRVAGQTLGRAVQLRYWELFGHHPGANEPAEREPDTGVAYSRVTGGRAHLYVSGARQGFGVASIRMAVASRALATASLISATVIAILLTTLVVLAETATKHVGETVAVLLLVPGLLGFLARPQEHPIVARYLSGLRALTLASAAMSLIAAIALLGVADPDAGSVRPIWGILAFGAWLLALLVLFSWLLPVSATPGEREAEASLGR